MGQKITKLKPFEGFCAESAGAITLFGATHFGIPVSTTHVITGAIIGAGARKEYQLSSGVLQKTFSGPGYLQSLFRPLWVTHYITF